MTPIEWTDALKLDYTPMDGVHKAFVSLLSQVQSSDDAHLVEHWRAVLVHTEHHFAREDQWMRKTRFSSADNHMLQHRVVLNVMREGLAMGQAGQLAPLREMASELASWFSKHTQSLDAALALHMRRQKNPVIEAT